MTMNERNGMCNIPTKVSVIIPVYNVEKYISRCLDSVLEQTIQNFEVIVVNDATSDGSAEIAEKYASRDGRIKVIHNDKNRGLMMTRKIGFENSKGKYVTFLDSDDYLPTNALELLVDAAELYSADFVCGNRDTVFDDGTHKDISCYSLPYVSGGAGVYCALLNKKIEQHLWGKLYARELFDYEYDRFENMTAGEDTVLMFQLVHNVKKAVAVQDVVYHYCVNHESSTHRTHSQKEMEQRVFASKYIEQVGIYYPNLRREVTLYLEKRLHNLSQYDVAADVDMHYLLKKYHLLKYRNLFWLLRHMRICEFVNIVRRRTKIMLFNIKRQFL